MPLSQTWSSHKLSGNNHYVARPDIACILSSFSEEPVPKPRIMQGTFAVNLITVGPPTKTDALETSIGLQGIRGAFFTADGEVDGLVFRGAPL